MVEVDSEMEGHDGGRCRLVAELGGPAAGREWELCRSAAGYDVCEYRVGGWRADP